MDSCLHQRLEYCNAFYLCLYVRKEQYFSLKSEIILYSLSIGVLYALGIDSLSSSNLTSQPQCF